MSTNFEQIDWNLVSNVKASDRRTQVLRAFCKKPHMNGELADELDVSTKWVRRQVKWLEKRGLVKDLTEEKRNDKLYRATEVGEKVVEVLEDAGRCQHRLRYPSLRFAHPQDRYVARGADGADESSRKTA